MTTLPRLHLFEFHDQTWCPALLREAVTDCVNAAWTFTGFWRNAVPHVEDLLERTGERSILDLCSGSGGPAPRIVHALAGRMPELRVELSDLFPKPASVDALSPELRARVHYLEQPVDALAVPAEFAGLRTVFGAFHHFRPAEAIELLRSASGSGRPLAVFEFQRRTLLRSIIPPMGLVGLSPLVAHWTAPRRWWRPLLTAVPVIPALWAWDSFATIMRTYTPAELVGLAEQARAPGYRWEVREARGDGPERITCIAGFPDPRGGVELIEY
ncbi:hypothetical protein ENSA5_10260 [Enhygromyxa salina]|uniref:Methyltransferase domain-containing protein n=1 Tax=Enhygromyxa salina TaxID=215803 RepID=A0A2S9YGK1_9BACT|nr:class I SAM-dependent methyltransferase [Enhygromyxa salina]PRQ04161.1 hypothetical protein ENSA5_10260 [Enhygromyxa salina]